jgi:hypothetical protein
MLCYRERAIFGPEQLQGFDTGLVPIAQVTASRRLNLLAKFIPSFPDLLYSNLLAKFIPSFPDLLYSNKKTLEKTLCHA